MNIVAQLEKDISEVLKSLYDLDYEAKIEPTSSDFEGDFTFVVFPLLRYSKARPEDTAKDVGEALIEKCQFIDSYNVIKGFLNVVINPTVYINFLAENWSNYPRKQSNKEVTVMVEYSSPNTNKPLHLGHIRNNLLGFSVSEILEFNGFEVVKANLINDRGIHICKSMLAWQRFGNGKTPESSGKKGDHLVGDYYVKFEQELKSQTRSVIEEVLRGNFDSISEEVKDKAIELYQEYCKIEGDKMDKVKAAITDLVRNNSELMKSCQQMLLDWENNVPEVRAVWEKMNAWVYQGFNRTYEKLGVYFDTYYYESNTYNLGKDLVEEGLKSGAFLKKEDGSVWVDLKEEGLDQKLILRKDGTSVYMTQDMGTAELKFEEYKAQRSIYVVGNEQDYHFKVLQLIMAKLNRSYAPGLFHLSYGMVDLPSGKMKSREGTVVDADDLVDDMVANAKVRTLELGKTDAMSDSDINSLCYKLGMAALKFFILKVDPKKRMVFNPQESIDLQGDTGPFVMYAYARIQSMLAKSKNSDIVEQLPKTLLPSEADLIKKIYAFNSSLVEASNQMNPSKIAQYVLDLAKGYNKFYSEAPVLKEENATLKSFRLKLSHMTANTIKTSLGLLGIETADRM
ncbi:MAG: arginine--tRNA ligase [Bacteroidia bacterium]|nr:arginine--tRNA ligase [Bacteroidia bacterium]